MKFAGAVDEDDFAELAQEAYAEMLERRLHGYEVRAPGQLIRTVAFRLAIKRSERRHEVPVDAWDEDTVFAGLEDVHGGGEETLGGRLEVATAAEALAQLPRELQLAFKFSRQGVPAREAARRLGLSRSSYHNYRSRAIAYVRAALEGENPHYERGLYDLVRAFVLEASSLDGERRRRAKRMIKSDPIAAALAAELRRAADGLGAAVPPLLADEVLDGALVDGALSAFERLRELGQGVFRGSQGAAEAATSPLVSGGTRGVGGAAGAGLLAKLGLSGPAVSACIATGATVTACVATGLVDLPRLGSGEDVHAARASERGARTEAPRPAARSGVAAELLPTQVGHETPAPKSEQATKAAERDAGSEESSDNAVAEPSPAAAEPTLEPTAPPVAQEFGVPAAGVPAEPSAPPPSSTADGGPATASEVKQQFGP